MPAWRRFLPPLLLVLAGAAAYLNTFRVPFLFDDLKWIVSNPTLRKPWPPGDVLWPRQPGLNVAGRPVVSLSLALNYAAGGLDPRGYHAVNLLIHLAAGLLLFGIVRRTLNEPPEAPWMALAAAGIWLLHPLQTESVTYVIQRTESLMGLLYLLTLYAALRDWKVLAVLACALGMATKEVMVTAPLAVLLWDRAYRAGSFREAWARRRGLYLGLGATWGVLAACLAGGTTTQQAGFGFQEIGPLDYARTQCGVILHYLRLAAWPNPLVFDYFGWPVARDLKDWLPQGLALLALLVPTLWALRRNHALGFPAFFFFLALAPTSSVMPIRDLVFEHRLYLPLAGLAVLAVLGAKALARRAGVGGPALGLVLLAAAAGLGAATFLRNRDYRNALAIWYDTLHKRPLNPRARCIAGSLLLRADPDLSIAFSREAIRLKPDYALAYNNLGNALAWKNDLDGALAAVEEALRLDPDNQVIRTNRRVIMAERKRRASIPPGPGGPAPGPGPAGAAPPPLPDAPAPSPPSP